MASHDTMSVPVGTRSAKITPPSASGAATAVCSPDTHAMPPTTAYWISRIEPNTLYCVNCTLGWRIDSSTPPSAAIADATENAYTFAPTTPTPSDAAARSLLRTASRRAPTRPRRMLATRKPTRTSTIKTNAP